MRLHQRVVCLFDGLHVDRKQWQRHVNTLLTLLNLDLCKVTLDMDDHRIRVISCDC